MGLPSGSAGVEGMTAFWHVRAFTDMPERSRSLGRSKTGSILRDNPSSGPNHWPCRVTGTMAHESARLPGCQAASCHFRNKRCLHCIFGSPCFTNFIHVCLSFIDSPGA